jgi:hypothetical protein
MRVICALFVATFLFVVVGCDNAPTSDDTQRDQQEKLLKEGTAQSGMPNIVNFRERKLLKDILELRDQDGLVTYTYLYNEMTGKKVFFCDSIGYGIPYATQYTNPQKAEWHTEHGYVVTPQADPNGLFSPAAAEGTWVMCKDPNGKAVRPVYIEPRVIVSPFKLPE